MMGNQSIYADLNKWEEVNGDFRVILTTMGTHQDLLKFGITLKEGLVLDFWMDDEDNEGNPDPLYFQGEVHYDKTLQHWAAVVVRDAIYHASELTTDDKATISADSRLEPASVG